MAQSEIFPVITSLVEPQALLQLVSRQYKLTNLTACWLIRSYVNDVYKITTEQPYENYALKVYRANLRTEPEIAYEQELLLHLARNQVRVAQPIAQTDGSLIGKLVAPEGLRFYVLYEYASGTKPAPPFSPDLYYRFGQASAQLHRGFDTFSSAYSRPPLDFEYLLERPLQKIEPFLASHRPEDWRFLQELARLVKARITELATIEAGLKWGICHGDLTLDNLHITEDNQFIFYDFDFCGQTWRAYEPNGVFQYDHSGAALPGIWEAFLSGYREFYPFSDNDVKAIPYMVIANGLWVIGYDVSLLAATRGRWIVGDSYFDRELASWRKWLTDLGLA